MKQVKIVSGSVGKMEEGPFEKKGWRGFSDLCRSCSAAGLLWGQTSLVAGPLWAFVIGSVLQHGAFWVKIHICFMPLSLNPLFGFEI